MKQKGSPNGMIWLFYVLFGGRGEEGDLEYAIDFGISKEDVSKILPKWEFFRLLISNTSYFFYPTRI